MLNDGVLPSYLHLNIYFLPQSMILFNMSSDLGFPNRMSHMLKVTFSRPQFSASSKITVSQKSCTYSQSQKKMLDGFFFSIAEGAFIIGLDSHFTKQAICAQKPMYYSELKPS